MSRLTWWQDAHGKYLQTLVEYGGYSVMECAHEASVNEKTLRNWCNNSNRPTIGPLTQVLKFLKTNVADFRQVVEGEGAAQSVPRSKPGARDDRYGHPHVRLREELKKHIAAGRHGALEFLAPPGFRKTILLGQLAVDAQNLGYTPLYLHAMNDVDDVKTFWTATATRLRKAGLDITESGDAFTNVQDALEHTSVVFLLERADRWLVNQALDRAAASTWFCRLHDLPCITIVAGVIGLNHITRWNRIGSGTVIETTRVARNDGWDGWVEFVCSTAGIAADAFLTAMGSMLQAQPGALIEAVRGWREGEAAAHRAVDGYHQRVGEAILGQIPPELRRVLAAGALDALRRESPDARVLLESGLLLESGEKLRPAVREWESVWRESAP